MAIAPITDCQIRWILLSWRNTLAVKGPTAQEGKITLRALCGPLWTAVNGRHVSALIWRMWAVSGYRSLLRIFKTGVHSFLIRQNTILNLPGPVLPFWRVVHLLLMG